MKTLSFVLFGALAGIAGAHFDTKHNYPVYLGLIGALIADVVFVALVTVAFS